MRAEGRELNLKRNRLGAYTDVIDSKLVVDVEELHNFMETTENFNHTDGAVTANNVLAFPTPSFPAWVPAVTVAVGMLAFLAASFYCRHRKVIKKRQILMDYFHIIFQYGGMRRKRMVAALCNTNAITLRELGRSFMISFDSFANTDNSCPFFQEDSAFQGSHSPFHPSSTEKKSFFRNRGMTITKKYRGPFIRFNQSQDNPHQNPVSFQDIVMKFKAKRPHGASATSTPRRNMPCPQYEGSSMCTIHGDDFDYQKCLEEDEVPPHNKQRRNAYIFQGDTLTPKFAEVTSDAGRHSLGNFLSDRFRSQQSTYSGKRNSEPSETQKGRDNDQTSGHDQHSGIYLLHGDQMSPHNTVSGSHGYIPKSFDQHNSYRSSEPTIRVLSPSFDGESGQEWTKYSNGGIVFLKRVPKADGAPGEFYYEEQETPPRLDRAGRASLSKVSYVPSGNMNEYYNSFNSSIKKKKSKEDISQDKKKKSKEDISQDKKKKSKEDISQDKKKKSKEDISQDKNKMAGKSPTVTTPGPSNSKRSRLSLGDLAISNFNRRIDLASDSLQEYEPDQQAGSRGSTDSSRSKYKTTWTRFKNVFTGSRAAQSVDTQLKVTKPLPERYKKRGRGRRSSSWQRFVSVFTGFRSLPETKKLGTSLDIPKASNSLPLGLDILITDYDETSEATKLVLNTHTRSIEIFHEANSHEPSCGTDNEIRGRAHSNEERCVTTKDKDLRRSILRLPSKPHSLPEEVVHGRQYNQRFKTVFDACRTIQNKTGNRRYRSRKERVTASPLSKSDSEKDFSCYSFQAGFSPSKDEYTFRKCSEFVQGKSRSTTPSRLEGNDCSQVPRCGRRVRSLSPLIERSLTIPKEIDSLLSKADKTSCRDTSENKTRMSLSDPHIDVDMGTRLLENNASTVQRGFIRISGPESKSQTLSVRINSTSVDSDDHPIVQDNYVHKEPVNVVRSVDSVSSKHDTNGMNLQTVTGSNALLSSGDSLPVQTCYLTLEHKLFGRSSDSIYYDTVSTLDMPSLYGASADTMIPLFSSELPSKSASQGHTLPTHSKDMSEISKSTSQSNITRDPDCVSLSGALKFVQSSDPLDCSDIDKTATLTSALSRWQSAPVISGQDMSKLLASGKQFISKRSSSHPSNTLHSTANSTSGCRNHQSRSPHVPALNTVYNVLRNIAVFPSSEILPSSPTERRAKPKPAYNKSQSRETECSTPEEIYMANVARLPRFCYRAGHNTSAPCSALWTQQRDNDDKDDSSKENSPAQATAALVTANTAPSAIEASFSAQISPYDTPI